MNHFLQLIALFFKIATFQSSPQDVPATSVALYSGVALAFVIGLLQYLVVGGAYYPLIRVVLELAVPAIALYGLLLFFKLPQRFGQTFTALCGSGAVIYVLALPVLPVLYTTATPAYGAATYLIIALYIWSILVFAHILRHAIGVGFATAISISIAFGLIVMLVVESIAPSARIDQAPDSLDVDLSVESDIR